jgi:NAD(P)-dependent dehydrogenase (short-subunit alcohol dehydrogenase family)
MSRVRPRIMDATIERFGGLDVLVDCALEVLGDGVHVNVVCPGAVDTPLLQRAIPGGVGPQGTLDDLVDAHPVGRLGTPEEIAGAVSWLASDDASFAVGAALVIDGGYTLR